MLAVGSPERGSCYLQDSLPTVSGPACNYPQAIRIWRDGLVVSTTVCTALVQRKTWSAHPDAPKYDAVDVVVQFLPEKLSAARGLLTEVGGYRARGN